MSEDVLLALCLSFHYYCFDSLCVFTFASRCLVLFVGGFPSLFIYIYGVFCLYCRHHKCTACFFFSVCPSPNLSFSQKRWIMPRHVLVLPSRHFGSCYTHFGSVIDIVMLPIRHFGSCYTHFGSVMNNLRISITHTL